MKNDTAVVWIDKLDKTSDKLSGFGLRYIIFLREILIHYKAKKMLEQIPENWGTVCCGHVIRIMAQDGGIQEAEEAVRDALYRMGALYISAAASAGKDTFRQGAEYLAECIRTLKKGQLLAEKVSKSQNMEWETLEKPAWLEKEHLLQEEFETMLQLYSMTGHRMNLTEKLRYLEKNINSNAENGEAASRQIEKLQYIKEELAETERIWKEKINYENERIFTENDAYIKCKDPNKEEEGQNECDRIELEKIQKKGKAQRADGEEC